MQITRHKFQTEVVTERFRFEIFRSNTRRPIFARGSMGFAIGVAGWAVNVVNLKKEAADDSVNSFE